MWVSTQGVEINKGAGLWTFHRRHYFHWFIAATPVCARYYVSLQCFSWKHNSRETFLWGSENKFWSNFNSVRQHAGFMAFTVAACGNKANRREEWRGRSRNVILDYWRTWLVCEVGSPPCSALVCWEAPGEIFLFFRNKAQLPCWGIPFLF